MADSSIGRINRHKEAQNGNGNHGIATSRSHHVVGYGPLNLDNLGPEYFGVGGPYRRPTPYPTPYPQQPYRGGRGRLAPSHRNKTLVLNGGVQSAAPSQENQLLNPTTLSWVTRTDRHLQLINRDVYEREAQQRTQAIEQSQKQKHMNKNYQEKAQFFRNMQQGGKDGIVPSSNSSKPVPRYEVDVEGVRFHVTQQGSKLVKAPGAFLSFS